MKYITRYTQLVLVLVFLGATFSAQSRDLPDFTKLAEENGSAVVNISTTQTIKRTQQFDIPELPEGSPFNDFFKKFFGEGQGAPREYDAKSLGSGFIISSDGYVLTNHHVVKDADEIIISLTDRREFKAKVIGSDAQSDVAVLKIDAKDLPVLKMGKSSDLKVGEWYWPLALPLVLNRQ